jgi:carboxylesterase type B
VLVVTFNYRLNLFGQPNSPQLASATNSQNFGLLDLDAAVQWVHNNIAAFGGDPARIVLFGQSAGSGAIDVYTYWHPQDTRVNGKCCITCGTRELLIRSRGDRTVRKVHTLRSALNWFRTLSCS